MRSHRKDRSRSRSPMKVDSVGRRRSDKHSDDSRHNEIAAMPVNQMMMPGMFPQGNMMLPGGMYPNMMMPNSMLGSGMMATGSMDMMTGSGMELVPQQSMDMSAMTGSGMASSAGTAMEMGIMGGMIMDPSMMAMYQGMSGDTTALLEKKEIVFKHCKLIPPAPGTPPPPLRARPPGCRTIFVGGLPDKIRESIVREIFECYGRIDILRLSKKNFCHIRFDRESSVEAALVVSGYRLKITSSKDMDIEDEPEDFDSKANSSWLHVDYAFSRDDQNEYERRQRQALRAQQAFLHMNAKQVNQENEVPYQRSPSPPRVQTFSTAAMMQVAEKIKSEEHFSTTIPTLLTWLERGECSKKNASQFYTMIQATNTHIRRLFSEKMQAEEEFLECKEKVKNRIGGVIELLEQVAKVFVAASHQRAWDHFTKAQRKNIETWQKMTQEFNTMKEEYYEKFFNEDEFNGYERKQENSEELQELKRDNNSLRSQLEAYKNEIDVIKVDAQKELEKFKAQFIARQTLQKLEQNEFRPRPEIPPPPPLPEESKDKVHLKETVAAGCGEARLIGVMSAFLQVHPQGASLDYVVSYVRALFPHVTHGTIHHVLQKHYEVFQRTTTGVGANIEHRWQFAAFSTVQKKTED